jgi:hypothetical protein
MSEPDGTVFSRKATDGPGVYELSTLYNLNGRACGSGIYSLIVKTTDM